MKSAIIQIGNSKGIRIPKIILEQCHIKEEVELDVNNDTIIIKPYKKQVRKNWENAFKNMHKNGDDTLLISDNIDSEMDDWEW